MVANKYSINMYLTFYYVWRNTNTTCAPGAPTKWYKIAVCRKNNRMLELIYFKIQFIVINLCACPTFII